MKTEAIDIIRTMAKGLGDLVDMAQEFKESSDEESYNHVIQSVTDQYNNYIIINTLSKWLEATQNIESLNKLIEDLYVRQCKYLGKTPKFSLSKDSVNIEPDIAGKLPVGIWQLWDLLTKNTAAKPEIQNTLQNLNSVLKNHLANPQYVRSVSATKEMQIFNELLEQFQTQLPIETPIGKFTGQEIGRDKKCSHKPQVQCVIL